MSLKAVFFVWAESSSTNTSISLGIQLEEGWMLLSRAVRGSSLGLLTWLQQVLGINLMGEAEVRDAGLPQSSWRGDDSLGCHHLTRGISREDVLPNWPCEQAEHSRRAPSWKREIQMVQISLAGKGWGEAVCAQQSSGVAKQRSGW